MVKAPSRLGWSLLDNHMFETSELVDLVSLGEENFERDEAHVKYTVLNMFIQLEVDRLRAEFGSPSLNEVSESINLSESQIAWMSCGHLERSEFVKLLFKVLASTYFKDTREDTRRIQSPESPPCCNHFRCSETSLEKDHILPFSILGNSASWNVQWLCRKHNLLKGNRIELFALNDECFRNGLKDYLREV